MRWLALLASIAAGCTSPSYGDGHLQCGPANACPSGFYCASDQHCWRNGSGPPAMGDDLAVGSGADLSTALLDLAGADMVTAPSKCSLGNGVILCDGFEDALLFNAWGQSGSNGLPSRDTTRAYRGGASLHAHITGGPVNSGPLALIHRSDIFPIPGTIYVRVWAYFTAGLPANFEQFINFADNVSTGYSVATDLSDVALNDYTAGGPFQRSATMMPLDRWVCVQLDVQQNNAMGAIHVSVDGQLLADLPQSANTTTAVNFSLGLDFYGNSAAIPVYDAWFDELIIDNKPTTCAQ